MAIIDLSNYDTTLVQSTAGRAGTPDGNIFFDKTNGKIEFISADELPTLDLTSVGGGATDANPLLITDGIKFEAIYAFENQERSADEDLRKYDRWTSGTFKFGGAYNFVNAKIPSAVEDRAIIRGSGWVELDADGVPIKKFFGNKGLSNIEAGSQPYYQQTIQGTATNFAKVGQIDEAILVYQDTDANGTPDIDLTTYEAVSIRTYGNNYDRKDTTNDLGIAELGGYSTGFAVNESVHLTTNTTSHPYADVMGTPTGVWANMELNYIGSPSAKTEFSDQTGTRLFTWELISDDSATLDQQVAWLDAFATEEAMEADGLGGETGHFGKDIETWYSYNASGQVVTKSGVDPDTEGLYLNHVPTSDQQRVVMTADDGIIKAYSFSVSVEAAVGATAKADANAWYHSYFATNYNSDSAITVEDKSASEVKGLASTADGSNKIIFSFDYTGDTVGGSADSDKDCVFLCEGDGGATQQKTLYTIIKNTTVAFSCAPGVENNV
ncbi:MAG: hypothetical protein J7K29_01815 [Candidatus Cloacimonetes bacterium]|nr:hypothetical protein [Candidatus Cloacimonadota bacterium]